MKLYFAAAVLMLVLAAHTKAEEETTLEQHFTNINSHMRGFAEDLVEKTKSAFEGIEKSDFGVKTRNWFTEQYEKFRQKVTETFN